MRPPRVLRRIPRNQLALAAGLVMAAAVLAALLAPYLPLLDPDAVDTRNRLRPPGSPGHLLGTDEFGRDMLARLVWGGRISLLAGFATASVSMLVGGLLGVHAGYWGGRVDTVVMRLTDILMAFPYILLAIAIVAGLGPGLANAMVAIAVGGVADQVHLLLSLPSTVPIAKAVQLLKIGLLEVDPREFPAITRVFLAAGIWGLFSQHFPTGEDGGLYSRSGQASRTG